MTHKSSGRVISAACKYFVPCFPCAFSSYFALLWSMLAPCLAAKQIFWNQRDRGSERCNTISVKALARVTYAQVKLNLVPYISTRKYNDILGFIADRSSDGSVSLRLYTYILLQSCLWVTPLCSTFAIFSDRYIVNAPLWESIFRLSVCLSVAVGLSRPIVRHLSCIYPSCRLLDQRSGSVVKKTKRKYSLLFVHQSHLSNGDKSNDLEWPSNLDCKAKYYSTPSRYRKLKQLSISHRWKSVIAPLAHAARAWNRLTVCH